MSTQQQSQFDEVMQGLNTAIKQMVADAVKIELTNNQNNFLQKYELDKLRNTITEAPTQIKAKKELIAQQHEQMRTARQSLADADQAVKEAEVALIAEIAGEVSVVTGKPVYSNDKARQNELIRRKKLDSDYSQKLTSCQQCRQEVENLEDVSVSHDIELKRMEQEFTANIAQMQSIIAEIQFCTAAIGAVQINQIVKEES